MKGDVCMRRFMVIVIVGLLLAAGFISGGIISPVYAAPDVSVRVDGKLVGFPDQLPYIDENDRTMVPVRSPMEAMGCQVEWNDKSRQATIRKGGNTAVFTIGSNTYTVNGVNKTMDTRAVITGDRTAFPIRFAAEAMGARVEWDASTYTVNIYTHDTGVKQVTIDCYKLPKGTYIRDYPEFIIGTGPLAVRIMSTDKKKYRFVCTSHEVLNSQYFATFGDTSGTKNGPVRVDSDYCSEYYINNSNYKNAVIREGMTIKYDVYNEAGDKLYEMTFQM